MLVEQSNRMYGGTCHIAEANAATWTDSLTLTGTPHRHPARP
ncbi:UNVERIFIED_ORG: hypothetical protein FHR35_000916 [Microbispora rosea subsp. rosea]